MKPGRRLSPAIPEQLGGLAILLVRLGAANVRLQMPVRREHIQPAVEVIIKKEQSELQKVLAGLAQPFLRRLVGEQQAVTLGNIERVHFVGKIPNGNAQCVIVPEMRASFTIAPLDQAIGVIRNPGTRADLFECSVVFVV